MAKIYLSELSAVLAEKHGIDRRQAQQFVTSVAAVIQSGLDADRMVKIKGLGTFKVIDVEARESVNVNTGERLVIDSHSKLTFLPDNAMKELVNKPFSQFETVVLNDGVSFDDAPQEETTPNEVDTEATVPVETEQEEPIVAIEEEEEEAVAPIVEEEKEEETPAPAEVQEEDSPADAALATADTPEETKAEEEATQEDIPTGWKKVEEADLQPEPRGVFKQARKIRWKQMAIEVPLSLVIGGVIGFYEGNEKVTSTPEEVVALQAAHPNEQVEQAAATGETEPAGAAEASQPTEEAVPMWEKYNDMDPRTRNGYYYITGLDRTERAKAGDTSARIARRCFGAAEMACYVEVFNGIDGKTVLEEGAEIKIPTIEPKRIVKKRLEQQNNQQ